MRPLALAALLSMPVAAPAQTTEANLSLVSAELRAACPSGGGRITGGVTERDLTGDGALDLIVDHKGLTCGDGEPSALCDGPICTVKVWIDDGGSMLLTQELRARNIRISAETPPTITAFVGGSGGSDGGGAQLTFTWQMGVFR